MNSEEFVSESKENENKGNLTVKRNKTADFIAKILCVLAAFIIWFFAAQNDTAVFEEVFPSVPVEIVNNSKFSVLSGDGVTVDIVLSGKRSIINKISSSDLRAYVDMSAVEEAGKYKFDVQYELPNGVTFVKSTSNSITVYADNTSSVTVPVRTEVVNYMLDNDYELGISEIITDIRTVTVTGPESVISTVEYAKLLVDMAHRTLTSTVSYGGNIVLCDKNGEEVSNSYIKTSATHVTATIPVYKYRDVPVEILYKHGFFNDSNCTVTPSPATVRIKGEASDIDSVKISHTIDEKTINGDTTYKMRLNLPSSIKVVYGGDSVDITIALRGVRSSTFNVYNIEVINPKNLTYELDPSIDNVTVRGENTLMDSFSWADITATVDLSAQSGSSGAVTVPVSFKFASPYDGKVYETGTYSVSVKINP